MRAHGLGRDRRVGACWLAGMLVVLLSASACGRAADSGTPQPALAGAGSGASAGGPGRTTAGPFADGSGEARRVTLVAAGDIACNPEDPSFRGQKGTATHCQQKATSDLIGPLHPDVVLPLGDEQYQRGTYAGYLASYAPTWGRFLKITHPVPGNHEYLSPGAIGYYGYFGTAAGDPDKGYYSFDIGAWHVVVLNSQCNFVGGCETGSPEERWLRADLSAHPSKCTLAAWHEPRWSSGEHGSNPVFQALWSDLYNAGVELTLAGHDHDYERFAPLNARGQVDDIDGVREIVAGTGGVGLRKFVTSTVGSEVRNNASFGVLALTLDHDGYGWRFKSPNSKFTDAGSDKCH